MTSLSLWQQQVNHICRFHPWYSSLLKQHGIHDQAAELSELSELPLMTAEVLEKYYFTQEERTEPGLSIYKTSGTSSGIRKAIYYSTEDDERYMACKAACFRNWLEGGLRKTGANHEIGYPIHKALADMGTGHAASTALTIFEKLGLEADSLSFALPIEEHVARLSTFRPELLYTMPSILDAIAAAVPDPSQFGIRKIIVVGEIAPLHWQVNMAKRFGIGAEDILDTYGSIEIGAIASYSHKLGLYVIDESIYAEAIHAEQLDSTQGPLQENEAVLVLTSFVRTLFPAVRYVTYDVVRDFQTIEIDGRSRQCFSCISKRIGTDLKHGEKISLYDIEDVVHQFVHDAELRVLLRDNKLSIRIHSRSLDETMLVHIQHALEHKIEEIGQMIQNRILTGIEVTRMKENEPFQRGAVKSKKIYL
ncbi:phenylacetate-coenzyme A ligase PaaK-like adenylate-forming protein [Paenibacillus castaneae]|uniref:hypothetical protein n=1 Tax=Paenibacillus castaneae TaxID=474957 RepID=UPI000C9AF624|nr:hypothetical protein [Paenibacillus castaneae]NIK78213.1 phenylacetate-coenzyme A ligase PaaK-like adenylate-forming protein [Paenibacillus castaneae]